MGQLDNTPSHLNNDEKAAREVLRSVTEDLRALQDDLSVRWNHDITRLQATKNRLLSDIEILEEEYETLKGRYEALQADSEVALTHQQLAQQQLWAKRLAQALATQLQTRLMETIYSTASIKGSEQPGSLHNAYQLLASLDASLNDTIHTLQQDLNSYQSSLSQQISRMHNMEQQGEAILEALINRLSDQLQLQIVQPQPLPQMPAGTATSPYWQGMSPSPQLPLQGASSQADPSSYRQPTVRQGQSGSAPPAETAAWLPRSSEAQLPPTASRPQGSRATGVPPSRAGKSLPAFQTGLIFIIFSTLALSVHNVIVGIIGYGGQLFGRFPIAGIFPLEIPNSLMLLWLRMLVVLPLMAVLAHKLYPSVWQDIRQFIVAKDRRPLLQVMASGCFLFMSQLLIYKAISDIGPGVAVTLLFMYPLITVPLAWFLFGDRPTPLRSIVMFAITVGIILTALPRIGLDLSEGGVSAWGILTGLLSSAAFALYLISMQLSFRKLHPVPVSFVQFTTIFTLASTILIIGSFFGLQTTEPSSYSGLYLGGVLLGGLTLLGYLCNNYGVRLMGAAQASIVASSGPVLTAMMAYLITPGEKSMLHFIQWIGVILVTLGVLALSFERLTQKSKPKSKQVRV